MALWLLLDNFRIILAYPDQSSLFTFNDIEKSLLVQFAEVLICYTQYHLVLVSLFFLFEFVMACICITNVT